MKDYKFFMGVLMESDIIVDKPKTNYIHIMDIERDFQLGEYFKVMMHLSCLIITVKLLIQYFDLIIEIVLNKK